MNIKNVLDPEHKVMNGILVGSPLCFSDTIVKISNSEMECVKFTRLDDLSALLDLAAAADVEQRETVRNILLDEGMLPDFCKHLNDLRMRFPNAQFALAYRQQDSAQRLMEWSVERSDLRTVSLLPMHLEVDRWLSVLRLLICGEQYVPSDLMVARVQGGASSPATEAPRTPSTLPPTDARTPLDNESKPRVRLTEREIQVLRSAAEGKPNKIIAEALRLSQHTIKLHMHHVMAKLGVHNRTEAAIWFFDHQNEVASP